MYLYGLIRLTWEPPFVLVNNTFENNTAKGRGGVFVGCSKTLTDEDGRELKKPDVRNNYQATVR